MSTRNSLDQATPAAGDRAPSAIRQALSIPNQLTMFRLLVLPFILIAMIYRQHDTALWLFIAAGVTDAVDGLVARRFNQKTQLGAFLDPMADKLLLGVCCPSLDRCYSLVGCDPRAQPGPDHHGHRGGDDTRHADSRFLAKHFRQGQYRCPVLDDSSRRRTQRPARLVERRGCLRFDLGHDSDYFDQRSPLHG